MARVSVPDDLPEFLRDHIRRYLETDGADGHLWDSTVVGGPGPVPTLLLTTRGRKTGNPRILPMIYDRTPTGFAVIASKAGAPTHPAWYLNLVAEPVVDVQVADRKFRARARTAEGAGMPSGGGWWRSIRPTTITRPVPSGLFRWSFSSRWIPELPGPAGRDLIMTG